MNVEAEMQRLVAKINYHAAKADQSYADYEAHASRCHALSNQYKALEAQQLTEVEPQMEPRMEVEEPIEEAPKPSPAPRAPAKEGPKAPRFAKQPQNAKQVD